MRFGQFLKFLVLVFLASDGDLDTAPQGTYWKNIV